MMPCSSRFSVELMPHLFTSRKIRFSLGMDNNGDLEIGTNFRIRSFGIQAVTVLLAANAKRRVALKNCINYRRYRRRNRCVRKHKTRIGACNIVNTHRTSCSSNAAQSHTSRTKPSPTNPSHPYPLNSPSIAPPVGHPDIKAVVDRFCDCKMKEKRDAGSS